MATNKITAHPLRAWSTGTIPLPDKTQTIDLTTADIFAVGMVSIYNNNQVRTIVNTMGSLQYAIIMGEQSKEVTKWFTRIKKRVKFGHGNYPTSKCEFTYAWTEVNDKERREAV